MMPRLRLAAALAGHRKESSPMIRDRGRSTWVVPLVLILALAVGCHTQPAQPAAAAPAELGVARLSAAQVSAAKLEVEMVGERLVGLGVRTTGRVVLRDLDTAHVFSPVTGRVVRIEAPPGALVKARAPLAVIASADVGQAFSDVEKASADFAAAEAELRRQRELFEAQAVARKGLEAAQAGAAKARAELDRARHKARLLRATARDGEAQEYVLRAPIGGEVLARNVSPGVEVQGQYAGGNVVELFTIGNLDPILVEADAFEVDLARIQVGAAASVEVAAYPGLTFPATVEWIADTLDPQTRTARVRCALANPDHKLKPEMFATVTIASGGTRRLALPRSALIRLGDQLVAFVEISAPGAGMRAFQRRPVGIDDEDEDGGAFVPITRGIKLQERVVTSGAILLAGMVQ